MKPCCRGFRTGPTGKDRWCWRANPPLRPGPPWGHPAHLDGQLKRLELVRQQRSRASGPQELLQAVDALRQALYARGLFLNALRYRLDFPYVREANLIEPPAAGDRPLTEPKPKKVADQCLFFTAPSGLAAFAPPHSQGPAREPWFVG